MTLAKGHMSVVCQHFQRRSSLKLTGQFQLNFIYSLLANGNMFGPGHMTTIGTIPIYCKHFKNLFLQNHSADCLKTWYVAFWEIVF